MTTAQTLELLRAYESRNLTFIEPDGSWPIVWKKAQGVHVWDAEGKKYLDLTAAFGVAATGHANPRVVKAGKRQMGELLHAMGDVHPHALKAELARELSRITFERWSNGTADKPLNGKTIFCNSGFEAVEAALKTALLATGKPGVIAFEGAYHGLGYGALNATHRDHFRSPFRLQLREFAHFAPFPSDRACSNAAETPLRKTETRVRELFSTQTIGAVLVEPVQGRGGVNVPPPDFLPLLRQLCDEHQALLILDEIYTGFGRTGTWFACEHSATVPDLICLGKALTGGFPLSACVGESKMMDVAWPPTAGEAIHTSTYLGHPVGCAMALAQIHEIESRKLVSRSKGLGTFLLGLLRRLAEAERAPNLSLEARGLGLFAGLEVKDSAGNPHTAMAIRALKRLLHDGFILLPEGEHSNVLSLTPPLTISKSQLELAVDAIKRCLSHAGGLA